MKTYANTVNGRPVVTFQTFESFNPATGEPIGLVPQCSADDVAQAVAAARTA
jgi:acyl-CoA reductase-like NAD-dependent aldehyde dehydrogenase